MKTIRIKLVPIPMGTLTHLVCIYCGQFHCQLAVDNGKEPEAGVHKGCAKLVHIKRNVKGPTS